MNGFSSGIRSFHRVYFPTGLTKWCNESFWRPNSHLFLSKDHERHPCPYGWVVFMEARWLLRFSLCSLTAFCDRDVCEREREKSCHFVVAIDRRKAIAATIATTTSICCENLKTLVSQPSVASALSFFEPFTNIAPPPSFHVHPASWLAIKR